MDKYNEENDYGCTKWDGVTDMTETKGTLLQQLEKYGIHYKKIELGMGLYPILPCFLLHYSSRTNGNSMTVLGFTEVGIDSWCENYYYFPGMTEEEAAKLDWYQVYQHVHRVSMETVMSKIPVAQKCSACGKLKGIDGGGTYEDIRGKKRCTYCHNLWS